MSRFVDNVYMSNLEDKMVSRKSKESGKWGWDYSEENFEQRHPGVADRLEVINGVLLRCGVP
jgi:hypothetical protein